MAGFIARLLGIQTYKDKTAAAVLSAQDTIYNALLVFLTFTALIWMSIFLYATFYYTYLPAVSHTRPVHLQFRVCGRGDSQQLCSFPSANVTLTHKEQFLAVGQPYKIGLELEMPESPVNQNLGMFMVCGYLKSKEGNQIARSCRSAMLPYKSSLLHAITTFVLTPFLVSGSSDQKQKVEVELFGNFYEQRLSPATSAYIQVQSHKIEIYRSSLRIVAHFTGLRHFMFHWPFVSAVVGILINLFFLTIIAFLSWYKYFTPSQNVQQVVGYDGNKAKNLVDHKKQRPTKDKTKSFRLQQSSNIQGANLAISKEDLDSVISPEQESELKEPSELDKQKYSSSESNDESIKKFSKERDADVTFVQNSSDEFEVLISKDNEENETYHSENSDIDVSSDEDKENRPMRSPLDEDDGDSGIRQRVPRTGD